MRAVARIKITTIAASASSLFAVLFALLIAPSTFAITPLPIPTPPPGSYGIEATKTQPPPTRGATISTPANGTSTRNSTITVTGICPKGLLVEVFSNGAMAGSAMCTSGSFTVKISLFAGKNDISALVFDDIGQEGPKSNIVTVTFSDLSLQAFGKAVTLTSSYGRRAAAAGTPLTWPLQLSGGTGPYAFSIDWGDGTPAQLQSQSLAGNLNITHTYQNAGIYQVNVTVTDHNGVSAFLQLVAIASGKVSQSETSGSENNPGKTIIITKIIWIPAVIALLLIPIAYVLGRRSQLVSIKNKMLRERDAYERDTKS